MNRRVRSRCRVVLAAAALWSSFVFRPAAAQSDAASARALFVEGRRLSAEGKYDQACPKLEESQRLDPGIGTLYNLADCWEHIGRTASAWARFLEVADAALRAQQADREKIARARAAALEAKVPRLLVDVRSTDQGLELTRDGILLGPAQWGMPIPVDPGQHTLVARAPSRQSWETKVTIVADGQTTTVTVPVLPKKESAAEVTSPSGAGATGGGSGPSTRQALVPPPTSDGHAAGGSHVLTWVLGGVGLAGLAVGTVFTLRVMASNDKADAVCPSGVGCSLAHDKPTYDSAIADAKSAQTLSIIGFAVGGAALAAGAVVLITTRASRQEPRLALKVLPTWGGGAVGASVGGAW